MAIGRIENAAAMMPMPTTEMPSSTARYDVVTRTSVTIACSRNDVAIKAMTKFMFMRRDGDSGLGSVASKRCAEHRPQTHVSMRGAGGLWKKRSHNPTNTAHSRGRGNPVFAKLDGFCRWIPAFAG